MKCTVLPYLCITAQYVTEGQIPEAINHLVAQSITLTMRKKTVGQDNTATVITSKLSENNTAVTAVRLTKYTENCKTQRLLKEHNGFPLKLLKTLPTN